LLLYLIEQESAAITATQQLPTPLIAALLDAAVYSHPVRNIRLIETHISWVILTGDFAYKIKKPVDLGFLDFSTLDRRHFYCDEEVRLNGRLAPEYYLEVVPISGTPQHPVLHGSGEVVEYAVRMKQFPVDNQLDILLEQDKLEPQYLDAVARLVADFHQQIAVAGADTDYGEPVAICHAVRENFSQVTQYLQQDAPAVQLDPLADWIEAACTRLQPVFRQRKAEGFIRECHGDMHLRNLAWVDGRPLVFDCIEFNPTLRWIDVISEVAFLVMDLQDRDRPQLAWRFLNAWLEGLGDYAGLRLLRFYLLYRAMVRAKVEAIRATQAGISADEKAAVMREFHGYLELAGGYTAAAGPALLVTRGVSASGKSTLTQPLLESLGAVRIRSDVERKRLFDIRATTDMHDDVGAGIYSAAASEQTYTRLAGLAGQVLAAGYTVIIDAACLQPQQVAAFRTLAASARAGFVILEFTAPAEVLRRRIEQRERGVSDADRSVLEQQLSSWQELPADLQPCRIRIDTTAAVDVAALVAEIQARVRRPDPATA
jgi:aminoglycoside phosphotransferase family enzyme/predicted kinase